MKQHDLRIRIQRTPSFQLGGDSTSPASPLPLHQSFGRDHTCASGASSTAAAHASNASQDTETPPTTPLCNGTFQLLGADLGAAVPGRRSLLRRNSSMSSVSSSVGGDDDDEMDEEWTEEEKERLRTAFDEAVESVDHAPFSQAGPPPSNLTHVVARNVIANAKSTRSAGPRAVTSGAEDASRNDAVQSWRHGLKSTRQKLLTLVKERQSTVEATPMQADPDATPKRVNMARQGSMDFLPTSRNVGRVAKLGTKLQSAEPSRPPPAMSRTLSAGFPRPRFERTNSLSTIAGSPSQPVKQPSSSRMLRIGSDTSGSTIFDMKPAPTPPRSNPLLGLSLGPAKPPKRTMSSGLGSAFTSPALGAHPSSEPRRTKAKFTHHSPTNSLELPKQSLGEAFGSTAPQNPTALSLGTGLGLGSAFGGELNLGPALAARERGGGSLGASSSFYQTDVEDAQSNGSISSTASSIDSRRSSSSSNFFKPTTHRMQPSSSTSSISSIGSDDTLGVDALTMKSGTPSPLSSTFDLNDLSLEGLEQKQHVEPADYWAAGQEAQHLRERLGDYGWNRS